MKILFLAAFLECFSRPRSRSMAGTMTTDQITAAVWEMTAEERTELMEQLALQGRIDIEDIEACIRKCTDKEQCQILRDLLAEHIRKHGAELIEEYAPNKPWVKAAWAGIGAAASAVLLLFSSCTISQNTRHADGSTQSFSAQFNPGEIINAAAPKILSDK